MLTDEIKKILLPDTGRHLIVTVGNSYRRDDGVGPFIAKQSGRNSSVPLIDVGYTPENYIDAIIAHRPVSLTIIDAADFGGIPGQLKLIDESVIPEMTLSTHMIPLPVITALIREQTAARIWFLGIQPQDISFGHGLTPSVLSVAREIIRFLH